MKTKNILFAAVLAVVAFAVSCANVKKPDSTMEASTNNTTTSEAAPQSFALIELFTSQGCSSCPPADELLSKTIANATARNKPVIALSFHVDYWNRLGWADPFSDKAYSQRQANYVQAMSLNGAYTPQMVVNGSYEFVGSNSAALSRSLDKVLGESASIIFTKLDIKKQGNNIVVDYALDNSAAGAVINFAIVSPKETTQVKRGENGGRTLVNEHVVKQIITKSAAKSGAVTISADNIKDGDSLVAFVQNSSSMKVLGATQKEIM